MKVPFLDLHNQYVDLKEEIESKVLEVLGSCSYIGGSYVGDFEKSISEYLRVNHAIGCSNGTDALILALKACGVSAGDEVITTPFSFFATAESISSIGAVPVFVDIKEDDYNIDPSKIAKGITNKTKAILPVHIFGAPCDMDEINSVAEQHGIPVIEDAAQAIGSEYKGEKTGTLGSIGCFSFYPTKNLGGAGDGGMVVTNEEKYATLLRAYKEHGAGKNGAEAKRIIADDHSENNQELSVNGAEDALYDPFKYYNYLIGYNSRLDAIQAAVLSVKLSRLDDYNMKRSQIASQYNDGLVDKVLRPKYSSDKKPCWHQYVVRCKEKYELCKFLSKNDVGVGTFYPVPLHKQKAFNQNNSRVAEPGLPVAEMVSSQTVCLPVFPEMTNEQVQYVIDTVNRYFEEE